MSRVLNDICTWVSGLPYWEICVFYKILRGEQITEADRKEILQFLLEDKNLSPKKAVRPNITLTQASGSAASPGLKMWLESITEIQHVNQLVANQSMTFSPQLTAVYGDNGAGKSGYARIFNCAGFSRNTDPVLTDVTDATCALDTPCATFNLQSDRGPITVAHALTESCSELAGFHCFDAKSVNIHLSSTNKFSFSPAGLELLSIFTEETDKIRADLRALIDDKKKTHTFGRLFADGPSQVSVLIGSLTHQTKFKDIETLSTVTDEEKAQVEVLEKRLNDLKGLNIQKQINEATQIQTDLNNLLASIRTITASLSDQVVAATGTEVSDFINAQRMAAQVGADQFKTDDFKQIGTQAWQQLIASARNLARGEGTDAHPYPQQGDRCILCHQPLDQTALNHFHKLWAFIEGEAQVKLNQATQAIQRRGQALNLINLSFFSDDSATNRFLSVQNDPLRATIEAFVKFYQERKNYLLDCIQKNAVPKPHAIPADCTRQIENELRGVAARIEDLKTKNPAEEIQKLTVQIRELRHRILLEQNRLDVEAYVRDLIWAEKASKAVGTTRHVTQKYNELFQNLVTDEYIRKFNEFLDKLGRPLNIKIETKPRKGETFRQILLEDASNPSLKVGPDQILSEGEKRAVAIADFLTEVCLNENSCGIILDDPVTSLDLQWREKIADLLVQEAQGKQVIVFTHDLPFLYHLNRFVEAYRVDSQNHWIKRGDLDGVPGYVYTNNSPALEKDYKKATLALKMLSDAKAAAPEAQEMILKQGFGALRTSYEIFIIYELLGGVVLRFDERVSPGRLNDIAWDYGLVKEVDGKFATLSRYIEGHSHSDPFAAQKPTVQILQTEIDEYNAMKNRLKDLKKQVKAAQP